MRRYRLGIVILLVTVAVLALSSCGSSSGNKRLTKQQFAAKAGALCVSFNQGEKAARKASGNLANPTPKILVAYLEKTTPLFEKRIADLKKLKPPAGDQAAVKQIVGFETKQATLARQLIAALKKNDVAKANTLLASGSANSAKAKSLYTKLGVTACAKSG
jgi:hypothetical protein